MTETDEDRLVEEPAGSHQGMVSKHTPNGVCFYASPACRALLGYEPGDLVGLSPRELVHPEDLMRVERFYSGLVGSQDAGVIACRAKKEDGTHVRLEATGWAMRDPDTGEVREVVTVSREAGGPAEVGPSDAGARLRTIFEKTSVGIALVDLRTGRPVEANPALQEMLGYSEEELRGMAFDDFTHPGDPAADTDSYRQPGAGERDPYQVEKRYVKKDGGVLWGRLTVPPVREGAGEPRYAVSLVEDVTGLRSTGEIHRTVVEHVAENIFVVDVETGRILESNAAFNTSLGYSLEEIQDLTLYDLVAHDRESVDRNIRLVLRRGSYPIGERRYRRADGTLMDVEVRASEISHGGGRALCVVAHDVTDRKRNEAALKESEGHLRFVLEAGRLGTWRLDLATGAMESSKICKGNFGLRPWDDLSYEALRSMIHPDDRDSMAAAVERAIATGNDYRADYRILTPGGEERWISARGRVVYASGGSPVSIAGITLDITGRKRTEEALTRSEAGLANAQRITHLGNWEWDLRTGGAHWSDELYRIYGYEPQGFVPTMETFIALVHPDDRERVERAVQEALGGGKPYDLEHRLLRPDGSERTVHCRAEVVFDEAGRASRAVGTVQDITGRRRAEDELRESHALLSSVIEGTADAIFVKDLDGRYLLVNGAAARSIGGPGCTAERIIGREDAELFPPEAVRSLVELDRHVMDSGESFTVEELVPFGGTDRTFLSTKGPYRDHRGEIVGVIGVATDITGRKRAEKALFEVREAERRRIARDLHDTVLHHIVGVLQTMQAARVEGLGPEPGWQIEALRGAIQGLRNAIYDLRSERSQPLGQAIESLVELNRQLAPGCVFALTVGEGFFPEPSDTVKVQLVRTVQEALTNARRHSGAGRIEVRLGAGADGGIVAEVADDGRGFDPGADPGGVGFSAMRERALAMGADLEVESAVGGGTRVRVSVPG